MQHNLSTEASVVSGITERKEGPSAAPEMGEAERVHLVQRADTWRPRTSYPFPSVMFEEGCPGRM